MCALRTDADEIFGFYCRSFFFLLIVILVVVVVAVVVVVFELFTINIHVS